MPLPIGHVAIGLATYETVQKSTAHPSRMAIATYITLLANLPDLDIVFGLITQGNGAAFHRGLTHSLLFALAAGWSASQLGRLFQRVPSLSFETCFFLVLSHILADMLFTPAPVSFFWPLELYHTFGHSTWSGVVEMILYQSIRDAGIVAVCLVYVLVLRYGRGVPAGVGRILNTLVGKVRLIHYRLVH